MKFETLKKDYRKQVLIIAGVVVAIVATVFFVGTRAKYRYTATYQAVQGTINYEEPDLWVTAIYIQQEDGSYTPAETVPTSGYTLNETQTYCGYSSVNGLVKDETVKVTYENGNVKISDITKVGTKCHIYFDKQPTAKEVILAANTKDTSRKSGSFTGVFTTDTNGKIFEGPADDSGTNSTYFFAGQNPNNWVKFGKEGTSDIYWRIIRINSDGTVRMIYNGTSTTTTGAGTQINGSTNKFSHKDAYYNSSSDNAYVKDNAYVGYMYGSAEAGNYADAHKNTNSSYAKQQVDTWYNTNLNKEEYSKHIDTNVGFCGDRQPSTSSSSMNGSGGYGTTITYYGSYIRSYQTHQFTLKCTNNNDLYTVSSASRGNKALTYPVGLITMDEVAFAGGYPANNSRYWLYTNQIYWTMSPSCMYANGNAGVFIVNSSGDLNYNSVVNALGVRPVINLKADTQLTGSGTTSDPYVVV